MMRILILVCCLLSSFHVSAESTLPKGCQALKVQGQSVSVSAKKTKLVFIHNLTNSDLWVTHRVPNPSASAGWSSRLQSGKWSALAVKKSHFQVDCIESRPGHEQEIPCEGAIAVCQWRSVKIPENAQNDTFWVAEDKSLNALIAAVGARGFVLRRLQ